MKSLKFILRVNAISSIATGLLLIIYNKIIADYFEVNKLIPFMVAGVFLLLFGLFVLFTSTQKNSNATWVKIIIALDSLWVIASLIICLAFSNEIALVGIIAIALVAIWVSIMIILQSKNLKTIMVGILCLCFGSILNAQEKSEQNNQQTQIVQKFIEAVNNKNLTEAKSYLDENIVWEQSGNSQFSGSISSQNKIIEMFTKKFMLSAQTFRYKKYQEIDNTGNESTFLQTVEAYQPTGKSIQSRNIICYKVINNKIIKIKVIELDGEQEMNFWG